MIKTEYYEQIGVAMTCRSFKEYEEMFTLDEHLLKKGRVLDVASGASSFVAGLRKRGYDAVAVDPLYSLSLEEMNTLGNKEIEIATQKLDKIKDLLVWESYESLESHNQIRINSFQQFLESYKKDDREEKYISAALPSLPFDDETFSLILCNHFLFLYQEQFDFDFHLQAINELIRITKKGGVIRIYPLVGFKNESYPYLDKLIKTLGSKDIEIEITSTNFRFIPSATHFLNIKK
ncbi:MAG: class I SAM-dependent methyltransferase [Bacillota bacterium]